MKNIVNFLEQLQKNNHKDWFDAHRNEYKEVQAEFNAFLEQLIVGIARFDPSVSNIQVKNCTYRIYRDTRFSKDKTPYKTHIGGFVCRGGKCSGYAGYYFHVEPRMGGDFLKTSLLGAGLYMLEPAELRSVRDDIYGNFEGFKRSLKAAKGFTLEEDCLKRIPKGFPADCLQAEYLKYKRFSILSPLEDKILYSPKVLDYALEQFHNTFEFNAFLNRAVDFVREEA